MGKPGIRRCYLHQKYSLFRCVRSIVLLSQQSGFLLLFKKKPICAILQKIFILFDHWIGENIRQIIFEMANWPIAIGSNSPDNDEQASQEEQESETTFGPGADQEMNKERPLPVG